MRYFTKEWYELTNKTAYTAMLDIIDAENVSFKDIYLFKLDKELQSAKRRHNTKPKKPNFDENLNDESVGTNNEDVQKYKDEITKLQNEIMGYKIKLQDLIKTLKTATIKETGEALFNSLPENAKESSVNIYFCPPPYPFWLYDVNDDLADASVATTMKTTGIKYIVEGISDAFASTCVNNPAPLSSGNRVFTPQIDKKPIPVLAGWKFSIDKKENFNRQQKKSKSNNKSNE